MIWSGADLTCYNVQYETGTAMNARESENYLPLLIQCIKIVSRYIGDDFF
jgi:hypothetical protein